MDKIEHICFKDELAKQRFLTRIKEISNIGTVTEDNFVAVLSHRDKLQRRLIKSYQKRDRLLPGRSSIEYKQWRKDVFERDNYTCVECHKVGGILNAHHIKAWADYPELRFELSNGATLCKECHELTDTYMWRYFKK